MTYPDPAVSALLSQYVPVQLDLTRFPQLATKYGAASSPDIFLLTPDGRILNRISRYISPSDLSVFLRAGLDDPEHAAPGSSAVPWESHWDAALKKAGKDKRPIFIFVWNVG